MSLPLWHAFAVSGVTTWLWLPPLAALGISRFGLAVRHTWPG